MTRAGILAAVKTGTRRARRTAVAVWRFARLPKWLAVTFAACLAIPGPLDELGLALVVGGIVGWQLRTRRNRSRFGRYMRVAWHGYEAVYLPPVITGQAAKGRQS
jgi:hypothetical protein